MKKLPLKTFCKDIIIALPFGEGFLLVFYDFTMKLNLVEEKLPPILHAAFNLSPSLKTYAFLNNLY